MSDPRITVLFSEDELRALNRCTLCGWHPKTQGHHPDCTNTPPEEGSTP